MNDIDCLVANDALHNRFDSVLCNEYDVGPCGPDPCAALEMKFWRVSRDEVDRVVNQASANSVLFDRAGLPFFVVRYFPPDPLENRTHWEFTIWAANSEARKIHPNPVHMSERNYVRFLYMLRHQNIAGSDPKLARYNNTTQKTLSGQQLWTPERFWAKGLR